MITTANLGAEYNVAITDALLKVLSEMGATEVSRQWGMAGSQEVNTLQFELDGRPLLVEAETYIGLSITGDSGAVEAILLRVREMVPG